MRVFTRGWRWLVGVAIALVTPFLIARRVRSTITVEPSPGAITPRSSTERDGWYIDLPGSVRDPGDYRPALLLIGGGFDMNRPDTIPNRLHLYSEQLAALVRSWTGRARAGTPAKKAS